MRLSSFAQLLSPQYSGAFMQFNALATIGSLQVEARLLLCENPLKSGFFARLGRPIDLPHARQPA
jgi:hypothetical protein